MKKIGIIGVLIILLFCLTVEIPAQETYKLTLSGFLVRNSSSSEVWSIKGGYRIASNLVVRGEVSKFSIGGSEATSLMIGGIYTLASYEIGDLVLLPYIGGEMGNLFSPVTIGTGIQFIGGVVLESKRMSRLGLAVEIKYLISSIEYLEGAFYGLFLTVKI